MKTVYIKGILHYKKRIRKQLNKSHLIEGKDYIEGLSESDYALIWICEGMDIRELKLEISAKYVWRHRLKFYNNINEMYPVPENNSELSESDLEFINQIHELI